MKARSRFPVYVLQALLLCGCATAWPDRPPVLESLGLPDHFAVGSDQGPAPVAADLDSCWTWLDDPGLALVAAASPPSARIAQARRYVALRELQARSADLQAYLDAGQANLQVARFREEAKLVTARDVMRIDVELTGATASLAGVQREATADVSRIEAVAAPAADGLAAALAAPAAIPAGPADVAIGRPSDLLGRRPHLGAVAGNTQARWRLVSAQTNPGLALRQVIRKAVAEVEDARIGLDAAGARAQGLASAVDKAEALARLVRQQYREGGADYRDLSSAETGLLAARDALAEVQAAHAGAALDLCVALGGGDGPTTAPARQGR